MNFGEWSEIIDWSLKNKNLDKSIFLLLNAKSCFAWEKSENEKIMIEVALFHELCFCVF
jgi:hypothetical protein